MTPEQQEYRQMICYLGLSTFLTIAAITIAIVLLRKRGMKSEEVIKHIFQPHSKHCPYCGRDDCKVWLSLHPQERSNPTTKENENG